MSLGVRLPTALTARALRAMCSPSPASTFPGRPTASITLPGVFLRRPCVPVTSSSSRPMPLARPIAGFTSAMVSSSMPRPARVLPCPVSSAATGANATSALAACTEDSAGKLADSLSANFSDRQLVGCLSFFVCKPFVKVAVEVLNSPGFSAIIRQAFWHIIVGIVGDRNGNRVSSFIERKVEEP